jgi:hypothetical protein
MQGKKLKGEGILVKDTREKTARVLRSFVIRWLNLKSPATLTYVPVRQLLISGTTQLFRFEKCL